ncbi:hypothetical protein Cgig2_019974 [Carnegiea gigantea]|uniref:Uncharacterized protein n=1 Tax=Carnegiea gigantea TaxID=171969 RepID=A0A9Q1K0E1_9CARY|nr:hypothetical protein Cgig2_019974 [Carnegiea gigantea]
MLRQLHCYGRCGFARLPSTALFNSPLPETVFLKFDHTIWRLLMEASIWHMLLMQHGIRSQYRKVVDVIQVTKDDSTKSNVKKALLSAKKKERIKLPNYDDAREGQMYHISKFLSHPTGVEAILNVNALQSYVSIDNNTYRCKIPPIQLLNFEVAPVLDLQVNPTSEGCIVELLSCQFEGSEIVESQNKYFSATMENIITWEESGSESFLDVDVKLSISLQVVNAVLQHHSYYRKHIF